MDDGGGPIVVAFDGSESARAALASAAALLRPREVVVVTVWESGLEFAAAAAPPDVTMAPMPDPSVAMEVDRELGDHAKRVAQEGVDLLRSLGLEARPQAVSGAGDVVETILETARSVNAAAIVVGSRGLTGLRARLEGSTSKGVLRHAPCPVLVVHD